MKTSQSVNELFASQIAMQSEMKDIGKDSTGFGYKYTSFESLTRYLRPLLTKHGLGYIQTATNDGERIGVTTRLIHKSGEWLEDTFTVPLVSLAKMNDYQVAGSAITYLKRYGLSAIVGIASDEDADAHGEQVVAVQPKHSLDQKQSDMIVQLIADTKTDASAFCKAYSIKKVEDLPHDMFANALGKLQAKKKGMKNEPQNNTDAA